MEDLKNIEIIKSMEDVKHMKQMFDILVKKLEKQQIAIDKRAVINRKNVAQYRKTHPEESKAYHQAYYQANKEKVLARKKAERDAIKAAKIANQVIEAA